MNSSFTCYNSCPSPPLHQVVVHPYTWPSWSRSASTDMLPPLLFFSLLFSSHISSLSPPVLLSRRCVSYPLSHRLISLLPSNITSLLPSHLLYLYSFDEMVRLTSKRKIPQLFFNGRHIGGHSELKVTTVKPPIRT